MWFYYTLAFVLVFVYFNAEVCGQECRLADSGHLIPVWTPQYRSWVPLDQLEIYINGTQGIIVGIRACSGAHILLQENDNDFRNSVYELVIGGLNNTRTGIRECAGCRFLKTTKHKDILHCNYFNYFWISWCRGVIRVGRDHELGQHQFLSHELPAQTVFNAASIKSESDTEWAF